MKRSFVGLITVAVMGVTLFGATAARAAQTVTWTGTIPAGALRPAERISALSVAAAPQAVAC